MSKQDARKLIAASGLSIDDQLVVHLDSCQKCRDAIATDRPRAIGQKSGHCDTYWSLQLLRAEYEGQVNNIVGHTEYGDEAPKGHTLW